MSYRPLQTYRVHSAYDGQGKNRAAGMLDLTVTIPRPVMLTSPEGRIALQNTLCTELTNHLGHVIIRCVAEAL